VNQWPVSSSSETTAYWQLITSHWFTVLMSPDEDRSAQASARQVAKQA
jgi:hypothetical protein